MPSLRRCREDEHSAVAQLITVAAQRYHGVIPADCWHEPYMSAAELAAEMAAGVEFWCMETEAGLVAVMGIQHVRDVDLIRHAYVLPSLQRRGLGGRLLTELCSRSSGPILIGTWSAATWAIEFYRRHGFHQLDGDEACVLLRTYWQVPERQIQASVVLSRGR